MEDHIKLVKMTEWGEIWLQACHFPLLTGRSEMWISSVRNSGVKSSHNDDFSSFHSASRAFLFWDSFISQSTFMVLQKSI